MTQEVHEIRIDVVPDRADAAVVDQDLAKIEAQANATREAIARSTNINPAPVQAGAAVAQRALESVSRSAQETKLSAAQLETAFAEVFSRTTADRAVAAQGQLQGALGKTRTAGLLAEEEIEALMSEGDHGAQAALRGLGNEADKARAKFAELKNAEKGTQAGFGFDATALQNYRAALENVKRAREDAARVQGLSKGEAAQLQAVIGPTIVRARAQEDLNSLLAQGKNNAQQHAQAIRGLADANNKAAGAANGLGAAARGALAAIGVGISVREVLELSNAYQAVQNKLRLVTHGQQELDGVTRQLFDVSNQTRQSFDATATVYARVATATKSLGLDQQQLVSFTRNLNQAVAVSGATAEEARAGLIQFSQGLSSGALRGDELRSVLEQLPAVADVIADHFKVSRGELRQLAEQGKLTTAEIVKAFNEAGPKLEEAFAKTVPTLGQSLTQVRNNFERLFGEFDKAVGVTTKLGQGLVFLSEHFTTLATAASSIGIAFALSKINKELLTMTGLGKAATSSLGALGKAAPFLAIAAAAATAVEYVQTLLEVEEDVRRAREESQDDNQLTTFALQGQLIDSLKRKLEGLEDEFQTLGGANAVLTVEILRTRDAINYLAGARKNAADAARRQAESDALLSTATQDLFRELQRENELLKLNKDQREIAVKVEKELAELKKAGVDTTFESLRQEVAQRVALNQQQRRATEFVDENNRALDEARKRLEAATVAYHANRASLEQVAGAQQEYADAIEDAARNQLLTRGEAAVYDEVNRALTETTRQLRDAESAAQKAGAAGSDYAGIIADLKAKLEELQGVKGLSAEQIRVKESVVGSFKALEKEIAATNQLLQQGGDDADLYRAHLADLEQQKKDAFEVRGLSAGQRRLFEELSGQAKGYEQDLRDVEALIQKLRGTPLEVQLQAKRRETVRAQGEFESTRGLTRDEAQIYKEIRGPQEEYQHRLEDINYLLSQKAINEDEAAIAQDEALVRSLQGATSIEAGYTRAFAKIRLEAADSAKVVEQTFGVLISTAEKAFDEFVETGKVNFRELAYEAVKELTKIYFRLLLIKALAAIVPGGEAAAGIGAGAAGAALEKRAGGGPVQAGRPYLVGEKGPELFTPGQSGNITPNGANVNVAAPTVNVTVANVQDPNEVPRVLNSGQADAAVINVLSRNRSAARKILA